MLCKYIDQSYSRIKLVPLSTTEIISLWLTGPKVTYVPPTLPEDEDSIFSHYETGINFDKYDDIMVDVSGTNPPQAIMVRIAEISWFIGWLDE